jgi:putative hydrolase of the HAD superfamily
MDDTLWIFDLDNTLYPAGTGVFDEVEARIRAFVARELGLGPEEAHAAQKRFWHTHGTTLRGLMLEHGMDPHAYLDEVHAVDLAPIPVDPRLDRALSRMPGRKLVFTNADRRHADRVLAHLGVAHHFEDVFDIAAAAWVPKPSDAPYDAFIQRFGVSAERAVMFEDAAVNLGPAAARGMVTVLVDPTGARTPDDTVHHVTDDLPGWLLARAGLPPRAW